MNKVEQMLDMVRNLPSVKRYQELSKGINGNPLYKKSLDDLLFLQRKMVMSSPSDYEKAKKNYEEAKKEYLSMPFMIEYLDLVSELNDLFKTIKQIFESEVQ